MNTGRAIAVAREWIETEGRKTPGFCGAHLMGSLTRMAADAPFPVYGDVDFNIIARGVTEPTTHDLSYKGLILEYGIWPIEHYSSPEAVLADPQLASNLLVDHALSDPEGILARLTQAVAPEYSRRKWVHARCDWEKQAVRTNLEAASAASAPIELFTHLNLLTIHLAGLLTVAQLKPPTHRRSLIQMHDLLASRNQLDLHEQTLAMLGISTFTQAEVESLLLEVGAAFDKAVEVRQTPSPFDFKLHPYVRPYFIQGSQQMIDDGFHREAMLWATAGYTISMYAILNDAPPADKSAFFSRFEAFLARCGFESVASGQAKVQVAQGLAADVFVLADALVSENSAIID